VRSGSVKSIARKRFHKRNFLSCILGAFNINNLLFLNQFYIYSMFKIVKIKIFGVPRFLSNATSIFYSMLNKLKFNLILTNDNILYLILFFNCINFNKFDTHNQFGDFATHSNICDQIIIKMNIKGSHNCAHKTRITQTLFRLQLFGSATKYK